jgi:hypothetical protein
MFKKIIISILFFVSASSAVSHKNNELRRQYADFLRIFNKEEKPNGFETFAQNLQTIESNNKEYSQCKMYLTQHSDTYENEYIFNTCSNKN